MGDGLWVVGAGRFGFGLRFRGVLFQGSVLFQGLGHAHGFVSCFDFRQVVESLLGAGQFDTLGEAPALVGETGALEDG